MLKLILWGVGVSLVAGAVAVLYPRWRDMRDDGRSACLQTIRRASAACLLYSQDHDDRLPMAENWMDALKPLLDEPLRCSKLKSGYGYAYNDQYSSAALSSARSATGILIFESVKIGRNEHDAAESMPVPGRHRGRSFVAYTDSEDFAGRGWAMKIKR